VILCLFLDPAEGSVFVSGFVGASFPLDVDFDGTQDPAAGVPGVAGADANIEAGFDTDIFYGGSVGARLPFKYWKNFQPRLELEISGFDGDVSGGNFNGGDQVFSGNQGVTFFLINNFSDWQWRDDQLIVPYFGGGIGVANVDTDIQYFPNNGIATDSTFALQGGDTDLATVSAIGLTYKGNERFDVYTEARYWTVYNVDAERTFVAGGVNGFSADVQENIDGITVTVGARINF